MVGRSRDRWRGVARRCGFRGTGAASRRPGGLWGGRGADGGDSVGFADGGRGAATGGGGCR